MKCLHENANGADLLVGYLEGSLEQAELAQLESHAAQCADCKALLAVQAQLDGYTAVPEVSSDFDDRLFARIAEINNETAAVEVQRESAWWRVLARSMVQKIVMRPMVPVALAASIVVAGLVMQPLEFGQSPMIVDFDPVTSEVTTGKMAQAGPVDPDIEQLEQMLEDLQLLMPLDAGA